MAQKKKGAAGMLKVGKIHTIHSIVYKEYEVIEVEGRLFAGKDAFLFPDNREDLRCMECLSIPAEWEWMERYVIRDAQRGEPKTVTTGKYHPIHGAEARAKIEEILTRNETGCLCLMDGARPYAIPINHAYCDGKLYMHSGKRGKKLDLIRRNSGACYMLYAPTEKAPEHVRSCHMPYESILFYGNVRISTDPQEKELGVKLLTDHYGTPYQHGFADMIEILVFEIDHATARTGRFKPNWNRDLYSYRFRDGGEGPQE